MIGAVAAIPSTKRSPSDIPHVLDAALTLVRATGHLPGVRDITNHLMAIGSVR